MGQAKIRGTRAIRVAQALERRATEAAAWRKADEAARLVEAKRRSELPPKPREYVRRNHGRAMNRALLMTVVGLLALPATIIDDTKDKP